MFCFTFVSGHNIAYIMLYSVQLKNTYCYLNSSLKLSDIVRGLSCQQSYCNLLSLYKLIIIIPFISSYKFLLFPSTSCLVRYRLTLRPRRVDASLSTKQTNKQKQSTRFEAKTHKIWFSPLRFHRNVDKLFSCLCHVCGMVICLAILFLFFS